MFKRKKVKPEHSRCSGSGIFDVCVLNWQFCSHMEFVQVFCHVDESFLTLDTKSYEPPKKKYTTNVKTLIASCKTRIMEDPCRNFEIEPKRQRKQL